jgi:hypothetical protein
MSHARQELRQWLHRTAVQRSTGRTLSGGYSCVEDYVLDRGMDFESGPLSTTQRSIVITAARRARAAQQPEFAPQRCFTNTARLVLADRTGELTYVEGFSMGTVMPVHHAWALIAGKVVDVTWQRRDEVVIVEHDLGDRVLGEFGPDHAYIGVPFARDLVVSQFSSPQTATPFLEDATWVATALQRATRKGDAPGARPSER